jgi:hypothetical protein
MNQYEDNVTRCFKIMASAMVTTLWLSMAYAADKATLPQGIEQCKAYVTGIGEMVDKQKALQCFEKDGSPIAMGFIAFIGNNNSIGYSGFILPDVAAKIAAECNKGIGDACYLYGSITEDSNKIGDKFQDIGYPDVSRHRLPEIHLSWDVSVFSSV